MTQAEINTLEHAARSVMAWAPDVSDDRTPYANLLGALVPALLILATAAAFLFVAF